MKSFKTRFIKGIALLLANQTIVGSFYRHMGTMSARNNLIMMGVMILIMSAVLAAMVHPYTALFAVSMVLSAIPYVILSSLFDPFVAWYRGETEKPKKLAGWNVILHFWPVVSVTLTATILVVLTIASSALFGFDFKPEINESSSNILYLSCVALIGIHQFFALQRFPGVRKSQKFVTTVVFFCLFLANPIIKLFV